MSTIDYAIVILYFASMIGLGFWHQRQAAKNIESYFLGGNRIHWLALAITGSVSTFDITGTMWMVTLVYLFGMKSIWNHWMWGFLMAAFFMSYMGKWVRRSNVMTGAEWMITRFGDRTDGRLARLAYALMAVVTLAGFIGYAFQGIGKFSAEYVNLGDWGLDRDATMKLCAVVVFALTTVYVLMGGLYAVVITHVFQTIILTLASIVIATVAYDQLTPEKLATMTPMDGTSFTSLWPQWTIENAASLPDNYHGYEMFGALVLVWVAKGLLLNLGGPGQMYDFQMFLSTRDPRDAAKVGAAWSGFLIVRWGLVMGIALLAISSGISLVADSGQIDAEIVMPKVLKEHLRPGVHGLVIAGLLAAFMSTFASTVNAGASYIVRDLWQPLVRPDADEKQLVRASYGATVGIVVLGAVIGWYSSSILQVWDWLMMVLGGAFVVPNVLRWYWWRFNGVGYTVGTLVGLAAAIPLLVLSLMGSDPPIYIAFPVLCGLSLLASVVGTYLAKPTDESVLIGFYRNVRPFGWWEPIRTRAGLTPEQMKDPAESASLAIVNLLLASIAIFGAYLTPMYLVGHWHAYALAWFTVALAASIALKFTWYDHLPKAE